jgi:hypothetical protein
MKSTPNYIKFTLGLMLLPAVVSCELYKQDAYVEQYVVDAWLVALEPMPAIRLSTTSPINERFTLENRGVNNAEVVVKRVASGGQVLEIFPFSPSGNGVYTPARTAEPKPLIEPNAIYELEILIGPERHRISAKTVIPDTFMVVSLNATELVYQGQEQFTLELTPSVAPNRMTWYIFTGSTLAPETAELTPFYAGLNDPREDFFVVSSGILNENSTRNNGSDLVELVFPWIGVAFYGPNRISASAVDQNIYDFIRSANVQLGAPNQSPGEIENLIYNIEGGIGIFGSYATASVEVEVLKPPF